jgi:hypothetical protein
VGKPIDYLDLATRSLREDFVERHPFFFLVGDALLARPEPARRTEIFDFSDPGVDRTGLTNVDEVAGKKAATLVLAVRKVQDQFPSMITVGRTNNNDIVIPDINISRFHAFFRVFPDRVELADAGSQNGTFIDRKKLPPKGAAQIIVPGEKIAFAHLEFSFLDAGATWDSLRPVDKPV